MNKSDLDQNRNNDENEEEDRRPPDPDDPEQVEEYINGRLMFRNKFTFNSTINCKFNT